MVMSINEEEELILLNESFKTLREDAFEVTELVVKGINNYKAISYIAIAAGLFSLWNLNNYIGTSNLFQIGFWIILTINCVNGILIQEGLM
jgi:hypothetical protein